MTIIEKSWMTLTFFLIVLSSLKIKKITQEFAFTSHSEHQGVSVVAAGSGGLAMAMSFSMPMPMPAPFAMPAMPAMPGMQPLPVMPPMHPFPMPMPVPIPVKVPVIDFRPSQQQQNPTQPQRPSSCNCQNNNQQSYHSSCPPCPFQQSQQQYPQQYPPPQYHQQQYPPHQSQCCQNAPPPQHNMPCSSNVGCVPSSQQCVVCRPGQKPGQSGQKLVPVAQVVLTPVLDRGKKCKSGESDNSDDDSDDDDSEDRDGCTRRCRKKLARMNDDHRDSRRHRRMNKKIYSKRDILNYESNSIERNRKTVQPVLEYVSRNGDVKYKTKISRDDAFELLGDNLVNHDRTITDSNIKNINYDSELLRNSPYDTRKIYPIDQEDTAQSNIRLMRAGEPIVLRNKVQHQILNPGKKELVFQSPKGNEITNLSLTFLFS